MGRTVADLWAAARRVHPDLPMRPPHVFHFCDNQADADECARLVLTGMKRATASSVAELRLAHLPVPKVGDVAVVTNWAGKAVGVIRTRAVNIMPFDLVGADFAAEEGEGDLTLGWWRRAHAAYYRRVLDGTGATFSPDMEIACERFDVIWPVTGESI